VLFTVGAAPIEVEGVHEDGEDGDAGGGPIPLVASEGTSVFTAAVDARTAARPGRKVRLSVNPARFHFFDRDSGEAIVAEEPAAAGASGTAGDAAGEGAPAAATSDAKAN
jgi:multiple sugar transport system ATP-binding protein